MLFALSSALETRASLDMSVTVVVSRLACVKPVATCFFLEGAARMVVIGMWRKVSGRLHTAH